jgi:hypothetical protein
MAKRKKAKTQEVAVIEKQETAVALPDYGNEGAVATTAGEIQLPYLSLLQGLSKACKKGSGVDGAEPGLLMNSVTREIIGTEIEFIMAYREIGWAEWEPDGGAFVGRYEESDPYVKKAKADSGRKFGTIELENGNELVLTYYVVGVMFREDAAPTPIVISFSKTKAKVYVGWNTSVNLCTRRCDDGKHRPYPHHAHLVTIGVTEETSKKGKDYFNLTMTPASSKTLLPQDDERVQGALTLLEQYRAGQVEMTDEGADREADGEDESF